MTTFSSLVSQFAHDNNGEGSSSSSQEKKRTRSSIPRSANNLSSQESEALEESTSELSTQVRKSMRLSTTHSRIIGADSVKTKPHHRRPTPHPSSSRVTVKDEDYQDEEAIKVKDEEADAAFQPKRRVKKHGFVNGYTPPEVYAHLPLLPDILDYDLDVLWVGINPGIKSSEKSHHFSGPTNHFWPCLNGSGLLPPGVRLGPQDDRSTPSLYSMGFTNLVDRPSRSGAELSATEARASAPTLMAKIKKYRPRFVCFVSKQAWDMFAGVGLGLQTAWVSWYDETEDDALMGGGDEDNKAVVQHNLSAQGYRMSPYFEEGPGARKIEQDLAAEGVPSPFGSQEYRSGFVKREAGTESFPKLHLKRDEEEDSKDVKMDVDVHDFKVKVEEETKVKVEEDIKVKVEQEAKVKVEDFASSSSSVKRDQEQEDRSKGPPTWPKRGVVRGSRMFVMPSTSGRVTQYTKQDKLAYFKQLAELVRRDRQLRGL
ncbi:hypothetical protein BGZ59_001721 [Podila verticillata]|nr:hypothetical protein BGZ59_001721 [Podila verticillata]